MSEIAVQKPAIWKIYLIFTKFRLSFLVILSALSGYLFAGGSDYLEITFLMLGGTLVTAASNGANQIWERELDVLMSRTKNRPLPQGWMTTKEAYIVSIKPLQCFTWALGISHLCFCIYASQIKNTLGRICWGLSGGYSSNAGIYCRK